jgi:hypothetical protein
VGVTAGVVGGTERCLQQSRLPFTTSSEVIFVYYTPFTHLEFVVSHLSATVQSEYSVEKSYSSKSAALCKCVKPTNPTPLLYPVLTSPSRAAEIHLLRSAIRLRTGSSLKVGNV